jgi:hypothetical protein
MGKIQDKTTGIDKGPNYIHTVDVQHVRLK